MSRSKRSKRSPGAFSASGDHSATPDLLARPTPLDYPASSPRREPWRESNSTRPLMRTVLSDRNSGSRHSPTARVRATMRSRPVTLWEQTNLMHPELTARSFTCARRTIRREVLFALKGTGKGAKAQRKFTAKSKMRC